MKTSNNIEKTGLNQRRYRLAKTMIGTILYQDEIAYQIRVYMWSAVAIMMLLVFAEKITLDTALGGILIGGGTICIGLYLFVQARRSWLLGITDPELKQTAYAAMLAYIAVKEKRSRTTYINPGRPGKDCPKSSCGEDGRHFHRPCG